MSGILETLRNVLAKNVKSFSERTRVINHKLFLVMFESTITAP